MRMILRMANTNTARSPLAPADVTAAHAAAVAALMPASRLDYRWADPASIGAAIDAVMAGTATLAQRAKIATFCNGPTGRWL